MSGATGIDLARLLDRAAAAKARQPDYAQLERDLFLFMLYGYRPKLDTPREDIRDCVARELKNDLGAYARNGRAEPTPYELEEMIDRMTDDLANASEADWHAAQELCRPAQSLGRK